jgi:hypothetical protein
VSRVLSIPPRAASYGAAEDGGERDEQSVPNPQTAYAKCKVLVERDVGALAATRPWSPKTRPGVPSLPRWQRRSRYGFKLMALIVSCTGSNGGTSASLGPVQPAGISDPWAN